MGNVPVPELAGLVLGIEAGVPGPAPLRKFGRERPSCFTGNSTDRFGPLASERISLVVFLVVFCISRLISAISPLIRAINRLIGVISPLIGVPDVRPMAVEQKPVACEGSGPVLCQDNPPFPELA